MVEVIELLFVDMNSQIEVMDSQNRVVCSKIGEVGIQIGKLGSQIGEVGSQIVGVQKAAQNFHKMEDLLLHLLFP